MNVLLLGQDHILRIVVVDSLLRIHHDVLLIRRSVYRWPRAAKLLLEQRRLLEGVTELQGFEILVVLIVLLVCQGTVDSNSIGYLDRLNGLMRANRRIL